MELARLGLEICRVERVVVVDRLASIRSALFLILNQQPSIAIVGDRASVDDLPGYLERVHASLLLLDWTLAAPDPMRLIEHIYVANPGLRIIALSTRAEHHAEALNAGAHAFVSKTDDPEHLLHLIRALAQHSWSNERVEKN